jgi:ABC-type multidrug transport system ATPase subunit
MTADKIVVISDGKVVEQGTHTELLALKGNYHFLVNAQQLNTVDEMESENEESEGQVLVTHFFSSLWGFSIFIASMFSYSCC